MEILFFKSVSTNTHKLTVPLSNEVSMAFVWCPPCDFLMGSADETQYARESEQPRLQITITKGFWIAKTPLTYRQLFAFDEKISIPVQFSLDNPVTYITWNNAKEICEKLTYKIKQDSLVISYDSDFRVDMPSEAQWEYACRAGTQSTWYFGDDENKLEEYAWYNQSVFIKNMPKVGQKKPNVWGLYDLYGMVYEWCLDDFLAYRFWENTTDTIVDNNHPKFQDINEAIPEEKLTLKIVRGGCIYDNFQECRSASRTWLTDYNSENDLTGLRPVLVEKK